MRYFLTGRQPAVTSILLVESGTRGLLEGLIPGFRQSWGDRIPIGVIYENADRPTYEEQVTALKKGPLVQQELDGRLPDYEALKEEFV